MLDSLHIKNFRCFEDLTIPSLGRVNLIVGKNNVGKSTLLEAVYLYAGNGHVFSMVAILDYRNDFFFNHRKNPRLAFDSLKKIFNKNEPNAELIISSKDKNPLKITYTLDIDKLKESKDIPIYGSQSMIYPKPDKAIEGFLVENAEYFEIHPDNIQDELNKHNARQLKITTCSISPTTLLDEDILSRVWVKIQKEANEDVAIKHMKIIDSKIVNLFFADEEYDDYGSPKTKKVAYLTLDNPRQVRTLKSMGEGIARLLQFSLLAFISKGGYLLIDEFENGLHYSIQEEVWDKLFKLAKELDIQVFATTHSEDTVKAFCKVSLADEEVDGKLISLGRSAAVADNGKILADVYDEKTLAWIVQSGMEVR
ncbi:AAA family ATPase [Thiothrix lacustris]|uniref:AAA family ATPase n=1 Tax=Thiothrix lacustris TaxID=525917 RepID=A0ABY9MPH6_9GAMM|nr:AAA family ATPase [Thiothrix lacustris]WML90462.1 AAA family ATPase [Thiothrix lacustris]